MIIKEIKYVFDFIKQVSWRGSVMKIIELKQRVDWVIVGDMSQIRDFIGNIIFICHKDKGPAIVSEFGEECYIVHGGVK